MKNLQKGHSVLFLLLVVVVLVIGGGVYMQTQDRKDDARENASTSTRTDNANHSYVDQGAVITLDLSGPYAQQYKTLFSTEFSKPVNFDGRFRVVAAGCGTSCMYLFALDKNTGKVYKVGDNDPFAEYSIIENKISAKDQNGKTFMYTFNDSRSAFEIYSM